VPGTDRIQNQVPEGRLIRAVDKMGEQTDRIDGIYRISSFEFRKNPVHPVNPVKKPSA